MSSENMLSLNMHGFRSSYDILNSNFIGIRQDYLLGSHTSIDAQIVLQVHTGTNVNNFKKAQKLILDVACSSCPLTTGGLITVTWHDGWIWQLDTSVPWIDNTTPCAQSGFKTKTEPSHVNKTSPDWCTHFLKLSLVRGSSLRYCFKLSCSSLHQNSLSFILFKNANSLICKYRSQVVPQLDLKLIILLT